jgi:hypothetical protein
MHDESRTTAGEPITKTPAAKTAANERRRRAQASARQAVTRTNETLRSQFEEFMEDATAGEKWFLWDVLCTRSNAYRISPESPEMGIASAFEDCISQRGYYVRVPEEELVPRVIQFVKEETEFAHLVRGWRAEHPEPAGEVK